MYTYYTLSGTWLAGKIILKTIFSYNKPICTNNSG